MRPVPPYSTDFLYSTRFPRQELIDLGEALGISNVNVVTTTTIAPERLLYHACLNGIQTYVKLKAAGEVERSKEIADLADKMYADLLPAFQNLLESSQNNLEAKEREANYFCTQLEMIESQKPWSKVRYQNTWNTNDYPPRWQKKAIETYRIIRERIEKGEYTPPAGCTAGSFTCYWSLRNLEYKHYRDMARSLIETHITQNFAKEDLLSMRPTSERTMHVFIGGIASGKSSLTDIYLDTLSEEERSDTVLHNADYLKYALYRSALKDGALPEGHSYLGAEVQAESSNALYEGTRKRAFLARQKFQAPNVVLNSIALNAVETQEGIASGGKVIAHHVHISAEEAILESEKRRALIGRAPGEADIRWSAEASARSLLLLTQPEYAGTDVVVHLYHREAGKAPHHYATIDATHSTLSIFGKESWKELSKTANLSEEDPLGTFTKRFSDAGYHIEHRKSHATILQRQVLHASR